MFVNIRVVDGVALRKESVDRNLDAMQIVVVVVVALRKESVDRNSQFLQESFLSNVALRKESVDRNIPAFVSRKSEYSLVISRSPQGERG